MKEINYEINGYDCLTPCPYQNDIEGTEGYMVGSGCCYCCPYWVGQDENKHILICKADEVINKNKEL